MKCTKCYKDLTETTTRNYTGDRCLDFFTKDGEVYPFCPECFDAQKVKDVYDKFQPIVEALCKELNGGDMKYIVQAFYEAVNHEHRYLQNELFIMLWKFFSVYGKQKNFDARNEGAVKWAKRWHDVV